MNSEIQNNEIQEEEDEEEFLRMRMKSAKRLSFDKSPSPKTMSKNENIKYDEQEG